MPPNLTITALAKGLDVDRKVFRRYVALGCPVTSVEAARAWKAANIRPRAGSSIAKARSARKATPRNPYQDARTRSAIAEAQQRELDVLVRRGALVNRETVRGEVSRRLVGLRDSLLQIPARLQSVLAAESDETKCHDMVQDELYLVLAQFVEV
jgi:hypothetical protein